MVKFVDYGNQVQCSRSQLRKDLVGLDTQVLALPVELSNVQLTNGYESHIVYNKLVNAEVDVELTEFPKTMPMKCKLHFGPNSEFGSVLDVGSYLVRFNMAKYIDWRNPKSKENVWMSRMILYVSDFCYVFENTEFHCLWLKVRISD